jgi:serine protease Do
MEPFENTDYPVSEPEQVFDPPVSEEPELPPQNTEPEPPRYVPPQNYGAYHGTGTGRKESPFANSPYVRQQAAEEYHYQPQTQPPQKPPKVKKPRTGRGRRILAAALVVALVVAGCAITGGIVNDHWETKTRFMEEKLLKQIADLQSQLDSIETVTGHAVPIPTDGSAMTPAQLYAACVDSVVSISTTIQTTSFYGTSEGASSGSGFILSEDGYVVTNYHVVEDAKSVSVILHDSSEFTA